ncbi:MAG: hypothetical protein CM1200mP41_26640 [Gammaproteobacteria bacterium]|nr:MAG: hypothetical protein CM1200mP41_26640 [Gammaproteobacteria bacterium]
MGMLDEVDVTLFRPVDADPDTGLDAKIVSADRGPSTGPYSICDSMGLNPV